MAEVIEPERFDLIVSGTGLAEAYIAGAAAKAGKTVLHVDHSSTYGSHWSSLNIEELTQWVTRHQQRDEQGCEVPEARPDGQPHTTSSRAAAPVYSHVQLSQCRDIGSGRDYNIDLAPKAAYCAGSLVQALLEFGAHNYVEFQAVQSNIMWREGRLLPVPASPADIFAAEGLSLHERRALTRFLALARAATEGQSPQKDAFDERPFSQLLVEQGLSYQVRQLMYAAALLDTDQEPQTANSQLGSVTASGSCTAANQSGTAGAGQTAGPVTTAAEGLAALQLHVRSSNRFGPATGAFLLPCYGTAELPQAFCRVAAVAGALYVLRCSLTDVIIDSETGRVTGVQTAAGQTLSCEALVSNVDLLGRFSAGEHSGSCGSNAESPARLATSYVDRAVAVTDRSIVQGSASALVFFPPHSLPTNNAAAVRVVQVGSSTSAAPAGRFVLHATAVQPCERGLRRARFEVEGPGDSPATSDGFESGDAAPHAAAPLADVLAALAALIDLPPGTRQSQEPCSATEPITGTADTGGDPGGGRGGSITAAAGVPSSGLGSSRPRALLLLSFRQSTAVPAQADLPENAECCALPDGSVTMEAALEGARRSFRRLYPPPHVATKDSSTAADKLHTVDEGASAEREADDADGSDSNSDDETVAALEAALTGLNTT